MAIYIKNKTRLSLTIATSDTNVCSGNTSQDVKIVGATDVSWNCQNIFKQNLSSANRAVNIYFDDTDFNSSGIYQKKDWVIRSNTTYGDGNYKTSKNFGCYYKATCSGGSSTMVERFIPNIDVTLLSQVGNVVTLKLEFPAYIDTLTGIIGTFTNLRTGATLGTISAANGNYITINEVVNIGDINEYEVRFSISGQPDAYATCFIEYDSDVAPSNVENVSISDNSFLTTGGEHSDCGNEDCFCLPVAYQTDIQTQITIDAYDINWNPNDLLAMLQDNDSTLFYLTPCEDCDSVPNPLTPTADLPITLDWERLNDTDSILIAKLVSNNTTIFNNWAYNSSFRMCLVRRDYSNYPTEWDDTSLSCSNVCFKRIYSTCYTTLVKYYNDEDAFCFYAKDTYYEQIRLPLHLKSMQPERKTKGYQKSNGEMVKLSDRITKSYLLKIDYMPEQMHNKLAIALAHDNVLLTDDVKLFNDTAIISQDDYKINWSDNDNISLGNAETKVYLQSNSCSNNSNC
jgi:hypothetical protein